MKSLADQTVAEVLAGIASTEPAPGAGAAGAITLALGVACARKALRMSAKHHPLDAEFPRADERLSKIGRAALAGADRDARRFAGLIGAMRLPHDGARERHARRDAVDAATAGLIEVGEDLVATAQEARDLILGIRDRVEGTLAADIDAALRLIDANVRIQDENLAESREHLRASKPEPR